MHPKLVVSDAAAAVDFYERAFAAEVVSRRTDDAESVVASDIRIGDVPVRVTQQVDAGEVEASTVVLKVGADSAEAAVDRAVRAGATVTRPLRELGWTDRYGRVRDPFGHTWAITTDNEAITATQVRDRVRTLFAQRA